MKRNQFWLWLLLLPPLLQCCEKKYPQVETIINGKIVDENDKPMEGVACYFDGSKKTSFIYTTGIFYQTAKSDKDGEFTFSQIIPDGTDEVYLKVGENLNRQSSILKNNSYIDYDFTTISAYITIGKTNNLQFKLTKR